MPDRALLLDTPGFGALCLFEIGRKQHLMIAVGGQAGGRGIGLASVGEGGEELDNRRHIPRVLGVQQRHRRTVRPFGFLRGRPDQRPGMRRYAVHGAEQQPIVFTAKQGAGIDAVVLAQQRGAEHLTVEPQRFVRARPCSGR